MDDIDVLALWGGLRCGRDVVHSATLRTHCSLGRLSAEFRAICGAAIEGHPWPALDAPNCLDCERKRVLRLDGQGLAPSHLRRFLCDARGGDMARAFSRKLTLWETFAEYRETCLVISDWYDERGDRLPTALLRAAGEAWSDETLRTLSEGPVHVGRTILWSGVHDPHWWRRAGRVRA